MSTINTKENILQAWITAERLSEGAIDKELSERLNVLHDDDDFYKKLNNELKNTFKGNIPSKAGILLYCDCFSLSDLVNALSRKQYNIPSNSKRFSYVLKFDSNLKLIGNSIFVSACGYIKETKNIPTCKEFREFENKKKNEIKDEMNGHLDSDNKIIEADFNEALRRILKGRKCYCLAVDDIESSDYSYFSSFFADDLEKVKASYTKNLDRYITAIGEKSRARCDCPRVNLDTKKESEAFNGHALKEILAPKNYPLSRFPSNPEFALSLMQQVAVNLAIGYDNQQLLSVNGPPGTGKSTLLYDVFAELVVKQAYEIAKMSNKILLGDLPGKIADKNIIVASSNNAAVQNIVEELPRMEKIDDEFKDLIEKTDYFLKIANEVDVTEEVQNENANTGVHAPEQKNWGLFSIQGGSRRNREVLYGAIKRVYDELNSGEYESHEEVYKDFLVKYNEIIDIRSDLQSRADNLSKLEAIGVSEEELSGTITNCNNRLREIDVEYENVEKRIENLRQGRPIFFFIPWLKESKEYNKKRKEYADKKNELLDEREPLEEKRSAATRQLREITQLKKEIEESKQRYGGAELNLEVSYHDLQLSSPWISKEYRIKQTELFATALMVRKQFLYENCHQIKHALDILSLQQNGTQKRAMYEEKCEAWKWINFVIPVISTTFSSAHSMFKDIKAEGLGHLFIDEAGQALPWAAVGLINRSKYVMAVGDPAQIEPVLTLNESVLEFIREKHNVTEEYLSARASVQAFTDAASKYGFYKKKEEWIGIPLWVHRRCARPIFEISNAISYDGNMVLGNANSKGHVEWWDIGGEANDKYVEAQGNAVKAFIESVKRGDKDGYTVDKIFVITPFRNVVKKLSTELNKIKFTNIGTVHTFQGKETDTVFFVLGADEESSGAANWAMGSDKANMMNVAATRAKKSLFIVGDKKVYQGLQSSVVKDTIKVIDAFSDGVKYYP